MVIQLSPRTREVVDALFGEPFRDRAAELVTVRCAEGLPLWSDYSPEGLERIRFAALKMSGGVLAFLEQAIRIAHVDWRDVLVAAGFGDDPLAHTRWEPSAQASYREATMRDATDIARIHAMSWKVAYRGALSDAFLDTEVDEDRQRLWRERFTDPSPDQRVVVATIEGRVIGFACAYGRAHPAWGTLLDNLHVLGDLQGRGIGAELVREIARWTLWRYPEDGLYLGVLEQNVKAQGFYQHLGATDAGGHIWDAPGGNQVPSRDYVWPDPSILTR